VTARVARTAVASIALAASLGACAHAHGASYCELARRLQTQSDALGSSGFDTSNKAAVRTTFFRLRDTANRAAGAAPAAIQADVRSLAGALTRFVQAMDKIGFDFASPAALRAQQALNDQKFLDAQKRVDAYGRRACAAGSSPSPGGPIPSVSGSK
jgi:hypothetical protein